MLTKHFWRFLWMCTLSFASWAQASEQIVEQTDAEWQRAKALVENQKAALGSWLGFQVRVITLDKGSSSPFVALVQESQCIVIINTNPQSWRAWDLFRKQAHLTEQQSHFFAFFHEVGHCTNQLVSVQSKEVRAPGLGSELYADVFSLLAIQRFLGQAEYSSIAPGIIAARSAHRTFFSRGTHSTAEYLKLAHRQLHTQPVDQQTGVQQLAMLASSLAVQTSVN